MSSWTRDGTNRLRRTSSESSLNSIPLTSSSSSTSISIMADEQIMEGGDRPQPILPPQEPQQEAPRRSLREYLHPTRTCAPYCSAPIVQGQIFNFRPGMIPLLPNFHGMESENPYLFIREFEEVCSTFNEQRCPEEVIRLKIFPFFFKG